MQRAGLGARAPSSGAAWQPTRAGAAVAGGRGQAHGGPGPLGAGRGRARRPRGAAEAQDLLADRPGGPGSGGVRARGHHRPGGCRTRPTTAGSSWSNANGSVNSWVNYEMPCTRPLADSAPVPCREHPAQRSRRSTGPRTPLTPRTTFRGPLQPTVRQEAQRRPRSPAPCAGNDRYERQGPVPDPPRPRPCRVARLLERGQYLRTGGMISPGPRGATTVVAPSSLRATTGVTARVTGTTTAVASLAASFRTRGSRLCPARQPFCGHRAGRCCAAPTRRRTRCLAFPPAGERPTRRWRPPQGLPNLFHPEDVQIRNVWTARAMAPMRRVERRARCISRHGVNYAQARSAGARSRIRSRLNCCWCSGCSRWWYEGARTVARRPGRTVRRERESASSGRRG